MKTLLMLFSWLLPGAWRRVYLVRVFGFDLHETSRIGFALVLPRHLIMEDNTRIGHLTVCRNLDLVHLKSHAIIARGNWITGFPTGTSSSYFAHEKDRRAELILETHAIITNRHLIDATSTVQLGEFATLAGFSTQVLTHSIDLEHNRQSSKPISIGAYCFVGTNCVLLGGANLPGHCVLGAKSLLNQAYDEPYTLYGGVPARKLKSLPSTLGYFHRSSGIV